jgi:hypothetical protein
MRDGTSAPQRVPASVQRSAHHPRATAFEHQVGLRTGLRTREAALARHLVRSPRGHRVPHLHALGRDLTAHRHASARRDLGRWWCGSGSPRCIAGTARRRPTRARTPGTQHGRQACPRLTPASRFGDPRRSTGWRPRRCVHRAPGHQSARHGCDEGDERVRTERTDRRSGQHAGEHRDEPWRDPRHAS